MKQKPAEREQRKICVTDFCGSYSMNGYSIYPFQYWAFWLPGKRMTKFGGRWLDVPDMPCEHLPDEKQVEAWAKAHGGFYFAPDESKNIEAYELL